MAAAERWVAYVDGGCHPNPNGTMGIGVVLMDPSGKVVAEVAHTPKQKGTNNEAEYLAVLRAITEATSHGAHHLEVRADSKLTVNTLSGRWNVKAANLIPIKETILSAARGLSSIIYTWIPREKNSHADRLATEAVGGQVGGASKYGGGPSKASSAGAASKAPAAPRPVAEGALCGACKQACEFEWQVFKNGSTHVRQTCPTHGFLRFTPREHPYTTVAGPEPRR